jgi:hypothetical protein
MYVTPPIGSSAVGHAPGWFFQKPYVSVQPFSWPTSGGLASPQQKHERHPYHPPTDTRSFCHGAPPSLETVSFCEVWPKVKSFELGYRAAIDVNPSSP